MTQKGSPRCEATPSLREAGVIHLLIPILVLLGAGILVGSNMTTTEKFPDDPNVYGVLVAKGDDDNSGSGSSGSGSSGRSGSDNNSSGSSGSSGSNIEQKTEVRTDEGRVRTEIRDDRAKVEVRQGDRKEKIEIRNGRVTIKSEIEDDDGDLGDEEEDELEDEEEATPSATPSAQSKQLENRIRSISKFPLRIDTATNQLIMTKNGVERVLTVLPEHAVQNMLRAHLKKGLGPKFFGILSPSASPSASPVASPSASPDASPSASPDASPSATPEATPTATPESTPPAGGSPEPEATESAGITVLESQIELEEKDGKVVYKIPALKHLRVLDLIPVTTQFTAFVSAETGNLLEEQQSLLARILDLLSP